MIAVALLFSGVAHADIAPECASEPKPPDYDEQVQRDFLQNYPALALTFSPLHGPMPHEGGRGTLGIDLAVIPPLPCSKRFVLDWTKTEDTNVTPVAPKIHASFAFPGLPETTTLYVGGAYIPPVPVFGQRTVLVSVEIGLGARWIPNSDFQFGVRLHATTSKLVADVAKSFDECQPDEVDCEPDVTDLYVASTMGVDVLVGWPLPWFTPYVSAGFTDVSTFFYIGDDAVVGNNLHPYASAVFSAGLDGLSWDRFRWGVEFYGAPGGYSLPDPFLDSTHAPPAYGHIYTGRVRLGWEF